MGIEEIRIGISQVEQTVTAAQQTLQQAQQQVDEAIKLLAQILQGADATEATEALGTLQSTDELFSQLTGQLSQGSQAAVSYSARL